MSGDVFLLVLTVKTWQDGGLDNIQEQIYETLKI